MNDQPFPHDPTPGTPSPDDERIDALARSAGTALRRPAPADGIAGVQRAGRRRRAIQTSAAGAAVAVAAVIGIVAFRDGDRRTAVVPATADTTDDTTGISVDATVPTSGGPTPTSVVPSTSETPSPPPETSPITDPPPTGVTDVPTPTAPAADGPSVVYGSDTAFDTGGSIQTQFDPLTGAVVSTGPMDGDASLAAQQQWYGEANGTGIFTYGDDGRPGVIAVNVDLGTVSLLYDVLPSEMPTLGDQDSAALPFFDRCQQSDLRVSGGSSGALPARVLSVSASPDLRYLTVLRADCAATGTLDQGYVASGYDVVVEVFDTADLDLPGREILRRPVESCGCTLTGFSHDSRYVAIRQFASDLRFRAFDLATGVEVDVVPDCDQSFTAFADQYGPWVGASTLAVVADCGDGDELVVLDVASGLDLHISITAAPIITWAELDVENLTDPATAWFVVCGTADLAVPSTCWVGHGDAEPVPLDGVATASFLPLGFRAGG